MSLIELLLYSGGGSGVQKDIPVGVGKRIDTPKTQCNGKVWEGPTPPPLSFSIIFHHHSLVGCAFVLFCLLLSLLKF